MNIAVTASLSVVPYAGSQQAYFPARRNVYAVDRPTDPYRDCIVMVLGDEVDGTYGSHGRPVFGSHGPEHVNLYV